MSSFRKVLKETQ
ncbi:UNVERIFIED_CONTAM: hypothetical protein GTU68_066585 [Idotea baltica]|nr:hypothetical protein [Idotea baltica]MCL4143365.1 hypothetical protein [Idotea baltica]